MDPAQIEQALRRAHAAGDASGARVLARQLKAMREAQPADAASAAGWSPADTTNREAVMSPEMDARRRMIDAPGKGMFDAFTDSAAFGFGGELAGVESALTGGSYDGAREAFNADRQAFRETNPVLSTASDLGGAVATALGAGRAGLTLLGRGSGTAANNAGRATLEGAAYGGLYGAGANDDDRMDGAMWGAGAGGAAGGVIGGIASLLTRNSTAATARQAAPTVDDLKDAANAAYGRAGAAPVNLDQFDDFAMNVYQTLPDLGYNSKLHPRVAAVLEQMENITKSGTTPSMRTLEQFRRLVGNAAAAQTPDERRIATSLIDALDNYMDAAATRAAATGATGAREALDATAEGRQLWSRAKKVEMVEDAFTRATNRAATSGTGGNVDNAIRQNIRAILDNPKKRRGFTQDEIDAMTRVVRGEPVQNVLRMIGRLSPETGLLSMAGNLATGAGAAATMNPLLLAPGALGFAAKRIADRSTQANIDALIPLIAGGGAIPPQRQLSPATQAVIRALSGQSGEQVQAIAR